MKFDMQKVFSVLSQVCVFGMIQFSTSLKPRNRFIKVYRRNLAGDVLHILYQVCGFGAVPLSTCHKPRIGFRRNQTGSKYLNRPLPSLYYADRSVDKNNHTGI